MGWQGLRTGTGHPGGGTQRFGSHVTERDNPDRGVLQQPAGIQRDMRCGAPIMCRWSTGRCGVGGVRLTQRVEERVHALPLAKSGDLRDRVEGVRCGVSVRVGDNIGGGVDIGVGYGVGIDN